MLTTKGSLRITDWETDNELKLQYGIVKLIDINLIITSMLQGVNWTRMYSGPGASQYIKQSKPYLIVYLDTLTVNEVGMIFLIDLSPQEHIHSVL